MSTCSADSKTTTAKEFRTKLLQLTQNQNKDSPPSTFSSFLTYYSNCIPYLLNESEIEKEALRDLIWSTTALALSSHLHLASQSINLTALMYLLLPFATQVQIAHIENENVSSSAYSKDVLEFLSCCSLLMNLVSNHLPFSEQHQFAQEVSSLIPRSKYNHNRNQSALSALVVIMLDNVVKSVLEGGVGKRIKRVVSIVDSSVCTCFELVFSGNAVEVDDYDDEGDESKQFASNDETLSKMLLDIALSIVSKSYQIITNIIEVDPTFTELCTASIIAIVGVSTHSIENVGNLDRDNEFLCLILCILGVSGFKMISIEDLLCHPYRLDLALDANADDGSGSSGSGDSEEEEDTPKPFNLNSLLASKTATLWSPLGIAVIAHYLYVIVIDTDLDNSTISGQHYSPETMWRLGWPHVHVLLKAGEAESVSIQTRCDKYDIDKTFTKMGIELTSKIVNIVEEIPPQQSIAKCASVVASIQLLMNAMMNHNSLAPSCKTLVIRILTKVQLEVDRVAIFKELVTNCPLHPIQSILLNLLKRKVKFTKASRASLLLPFIEELVDYTTDFSQRKQMIIDKREVFIEAIVSATSLKEELDVISPGIIRRCEVFNAGFMDRINLVEEWEFGLLKVALLEFIGEEN